MFSPPKGILSAANIDESYP
ncbi:hypothetical protein CGLO_13998 [Colletotrichum gloeosporioides Cg-14]|uniref:Uncharacterized protein n=1 Tax=Colletotrichum gloeosporioides (strain Cg-14) TaxID=1237896 RepID=T0K2G8_COLGC|nr:hypothetical protein CGLO_13998 [Colletotrichum gloeosporioides Cg-14]